jgi:superfamily II DNA or RNA helicase
MLQVELADPAITVHGWMPAMDKIGEYTLKLRKSPEEMHAEKERLKAAYGKSTKTKVNPMKYEKGTVIEHDSEDPNTVYFLPGLWPRVKDWMEKNNVEYEIAADNRNPDIRPPIDFEAIKDVQFRETQDLALALIATSDCGVIEALPGWGKTYLFGIICRAFPTLNILITTDSISVVETGYRYLCEQLPGQVGILTGMKDTSHNKRVVICTAKSICKIQPERVNLCLIDEAHFLGAGQVSQDIMKFCFCRKFGFTATPWRNDGSQLVMESIVGPTIMKMDYEEGVENGIVVPMKYAMLKCNWVPSVCHKEGINEVTMKRYAYWRNNVRNLAIADFVKAFHKQAPDAQLLIIVAALEHAIALSMLLPWMKVIYAEGQDFKGMDKKFPKEKYPNLDIESYKMKPKQLKIARAAFAKGTLKFVIATFTLKQGVSANNLRLVVRADGSTSNIPGIQIPGRVSRLAEGKDYGYMVDVTDEGCPWTKGRAIKREKLYQEQKWIKINPQDIINDFAGQTITDTQTDTGSTGTEESEC